MDVVLLFSTATWYSLGNLSSVKILKQLLPIHTVLEQSGHQQAHCSLVEQAISWVTQQIEKLVLVVPFMHNSAQR